MSHNMYGEQEAQKARYGEEGAGSMQAKLCIVQSRLFKWLWMGAAGAVMGILMARGFQML